MHISCVLTVRPIDNSHMYGNSGTVEFYHISSVSNGKSSMVLCYTMYYRCYPSYSMNLAVPEFIESKLQRAGTYMKLHS